MDGTAAPAITAAAAEVTEAAEAMEVASESGMPGSMSGAARQLSRTIAGTREEWLPPGTRTLPPSAVGRRTC